MITLIKLTENDKRLIIVLLLVLILAFVIVGYASLLVKKIMEKQGSKADDMLNNVVKAEYFDKENKLVHFGIRKNCRVFFREARVPFLIIFASVIAYVLFCLFSGKWGYNPFVRVDTVNSELHGFATIFPKLQWPKEKFFGVKLISGWPEVTIPAHLYGDAWFSYIFVPVFIIGCVWFLIYVQAYIARSIRIRKIAHGIYRKKLVPDENTQPAPNQTLNNQ